MTKHKHKRVYKRTALSLVKRLVQLEFGKDFNARGIFRFLEDVGYYHISSEFILSDIHYYKNTRAAHRSIHGRITNKLRNSIKDENKYPQYKSQLRWMRRHLAAEKAREESLNVKPVRKLLP